MGDLDPPDEIAEAYDSIVDVYGTVADSDANITDPALATNFADVGDDIAAVDAFITDNCTDESPDSLDE